MGIEDGYTCDGCGLPFTEQEWDNRLTPHETDCPNYYSYLTGIYVLESCECDRNYHDGCEPEEENEDTGL